MEMNTKVRYTGSQLVNIGYTKSPLGITVAERCVVKHIKAVVFGSAAIAEMFAKYLPHRFSWL